MGGELAKTFRLLFYYGIKKTFEKGPNNLIADRNLSIYCLMLGGSKPSPLGEGFSWYFLPSANKRMNHESGFGERQYVSESNKQF